MGLEEGQSMNRDVSYDVVDDTSFIFKMSVG